MIFNYLIIILLTILCVSLRSVVHILAPYGSGVDQWFWKAYIREYKKNKKMPPELSQFVLDEGQWYPPLFGIIISNFTEAFVFKYSNLIAILIDLSRMYLLLYCVYILTGRFNSVIIAGIIYSFTPILISYNSQLNPRSIGAIFLDIFFINILFYNIDNHTNFIFITIALIISSTLILLVHKMTTQLLVFFLIIISLIQNNYFYILILIASIFLALIVSKGFYWKVLRAHLDIIKFWNRNWKYLSAHPVKESSIYKDPNYKSNRYFQSGIIGFFKPLNFIIAFNPWVWVAILLYLLNDYENRYSENLDSLLFIIIIICITFTLSTTFLPFMRCFGNGYLYGFNTAFIAALSISVIWGGLKHSLLINIILVLSSVLVLIFLFLYFKKIYYSKTLKTDKDLNGIIDILKNQPDGVVMCFPQHWHDLVAFKTNKKVFFGGHGYGFNKLELIFPIIKDNISTIVKNNNIKYLLTYQGYLSTKFITELNYKNKLELGYYVIYVL
jgi:hypothetical protein